MPMLDLDALVGLALALLCGVLIGIERQWHHKNAGVKTHALVSLGAATFSLVSQRGLGPGSNPVQIAAGIVTGIGFIGGGLIMRRGSSIQGINSAATLWATASLGLAAGAGHYGLSITALVLILLTQVTLPRLEAWVNRKAGPLGVRPDYRLSVAFAAQAAPAVREALDAWASTPGIQWVEHSEARLEAGEVRLEARVAVPGEAGLELRRLLERIAALPGVVRTEWTRLDDDES
jgi:putative Mg2+ transporter-C (MgtC) family protein